MPSPRRLVLEVGNSRWKAGLFAPAVPSGSPGENARPPAPLASLRVAHGEAPGPPLQAFLAEHAAGATLEPAIWAGVNPAGAAALLSAWPADCGPPPTELSRATLDRLIENHTCKPERVGTDRLLNALAAAALAPPDRYFLTVADCGTATTVDQVGLHADRRPAFLAGAILPGVILCTRALHTQTALLPEVTFEANAPADGLDTEAAIRRGVLEMQAAALDRLLTDDSIRLLDGTVPDQHREIWPVLTGGAASLIADRLRLVRPTIVPHLTLIGLALAAEAT